MRNIKLTIAYDGTRYCGWQFQKNGASIQETIENALAKITDEKIHITGSGRTDAGVHAKAQIANFKTRSKVPLKKLQMALNSNLPDDIVILHVEEMSQKFDAQRSARSKLYCYTIVNSNFMDPFMRKYAAKCFYKLDLKKMRAAARALTGRHDFKSFQTNDGMGEKNTIRTIKRLAIEKNENIVYIYIEADGFLYNMVRNIVGTLVEIGRGKFSAECIKNILSKKNRRLCGPTMPARGLCLLKVNY